MGHEGFVLSTVFNGDGTRLYSASLEGTINVWDVESGQCMHICEGHQGPVRALAYDEATEQIFSGSKDGTVVQRDAETGGVVRRFHADGGGIFSLALNERVLASGSFDGRIRLWDTETGQHTATIDAHTDAVSCLAFVSDELLVSGSRDGYVHVWERDSGKCAKSLFEHTEAVTKIAALSDGIHALTVGEDGRIVLWDCDPWSSAVSDTRWVRVVDGEEPIWGLALAPRGRFAIVGAAGGTIRYHVEDGSPADDLPLSAFAHRAIAISPDETLVALGGDDGNLLLYSLTEQRVLHELKGDASGYIAIAAWGEHAALGHADGSITNVDEDGNQHVRPGAHAMMTYNVCAIDENRFASTGFDSRVCVWRWGGGEPEKTMIHPGNMFALRCTADGTRLLSVGGDAFRLWDIETATALVEVTDIGSGSHTVGDMNHDASFIVTGGEDRYIRCWSGSGELLAEHEREHKMTCVLTLVPGTRDALLGDMFGRIWRMSLDTGEAELLHEEHEDWIRLLYVSPDGRTLLSVSQESVCVVYDLVTRRVREVEGLQRSIPAAMIDASGGAVAATNDGSIIRAGLTA